MKTLWKVNRRLRSGKNIWGSSFKPWQSYSQQLGATLRKDYQMRPNAHSPAVAPDTWKLSWRALNLRMCNSWGLSWGFWTISPKSSHCCQAAERFAPQRTKWRSPAECSQAMDKAKQILTTSKVLTHYDVTMTLQLAADASHSTDLELSYHMCHQTVRRNQ